MFGNYFRSLDDKNRVIIPAKLRSQLGRVCYVTMGPDQVMEMRDEQAFAKYRDKLLSTNMLNADARKFARIVLGGTFELEVDDAGRISLPEHYLHQAKITKEVAFVGVGNKVELWDRTAFEHFQKQHAASGSLDELAKQLLKSGVEF